MSLRGSVATEAISILMAMEKHYYVYIATNKGRTVLYAGVTNNLLARVNQHKEKIKINSFTAKYKANIIVYYEVYSSIGRALFREKQIKAGSRQKKINLIISVNPDWRNLIKDA